MLSVMGHASVDDLVRSTVPEAILSSDRLQLPAAMSESAYLDHIDAIAAENKLFRNYIGMGYHSTEVPSVIRTKRFGESRAGTQRTPPTRLRSRRGGSRPC